MSEVDGYLIFYPKGLTALTRTERPVNTPKVLQLNSEPASASTVALCA
jgi:hypothetical protein